MSNAVSSVMDSLFLNYLFSSIIFGWMDGRMDGWMDRRMDGEMDGQMIGWMDGWMDGWKEGGGWKSNIIMVIIM